MFDPSKSEITINLRVVFPTPIKSNLLLYPLYYAEAYNEFAGPMSASLRPGKTASFNMLQRWRTVGNIVSDLTGSRFEPQTSASETNALQLDLQSTIYLSLLYLLRHKNFEYDFGISF